jgi:hypothetical protein
MIIVPGVRLRREENFDKLCTAHYKSMIKVSLILAAGKEGETQTGGVGIET